VAGSHARAAAREACRAAFMGRLRGLAIRAGFNPVIETSIDEAMAVGAKAEDEGRTWLRSVRPISVVDCPEEEDGVTTAEGRSEVR